MKRALILAALLTALGVYGAIVLWLALTGEPGHMMAAALLAAAPLVVLMHQSLRGAAVEREHIVAEIRKLRAELQALNRNTK